MGKGEHPEKYGAGAKTSTVGMNAGGVVVGLQKRSQFAIVVAKDIQKKLRGGGGRATAGPRGNRRTATIPRLGHCSIRKRPKRKSSGLTRRHLRAELHRKIEVGGDGGGTAMSGKNVQPSKAARGGR